MNPILVLVLLQKKIKLLPHSNTAYARVTCQLSKITKRDTSINELNAVEICDDLLTSVASKEKPIFFVRLGN